MELKFSKSPGIELSWGMLQNKEEWIDWTKDVLKTLMDALLSCSETKVVIDNDEKVFIEKTAIELFEEISQCGYTEGYSSAECDYND